MSREKLKSCNYIRSCIVLLSWAVLHNNELSRYLSVQRSITFQTCCFNKSKSLTTNCSLIYVKRKWCNNKLSSQSIVHLISPMFNAFLTWSWRSWVFVYCGKTTSLKTETIHWKPHRKRMNMKHEAFRLSSQKKAEMEYQKFLHLNLNSSHLIHS